MFIESVHFYLPHQTLLVVDTYQPHCCGDLRVRAMFNFIFAYMAEVEGTTDYCSIRKREKEGEKSVPQ